MAYCKIKPIRATPLKTIQYVSNPNKTDGGDFLFSSGCSTDPVLAHKQMEEHRNRFGKNDKILLHHGILSFPKGEIDPQRAYAFAQEFMKGKFDGYQYYGSVHTDKRHTHIHFVINSVGKDGMKYKGNKEQLSKVRAWVDQCCEKYQLSVITPKNQGVSYKEWMAQENRTSWKAQVKEDIDRVISQSDSFEDFLTRMRREGYSIKHGEHVTHMLFKKEGMQRGIRGKTIGADYTEDAIKNRIRYQKYQFTPVSKGRWKRPKRKLKKAEKEMWRLYYRKADLSTNLAIGIHLAFAIATGKKTPGFSPHKKKYAPVAIKREVKKLAEQIRFLRQEGIRTMEDLNRKIEAIEKELEVVTPEEGKELMRQLKQCHEIKQRQKKGKREKQQKEKTENRKEQERI